MQPQASLSVNLRELCRNAPDLHKAAGGLQTVVCGQVCLVPLSDFQEEDCETLYNACFTEREKRRVFYEVAGTADVVVLFALSEATCSLLESRFGEVLYRSSVTPLLRRFARKAAAGDGEKYVYVYPHDDRADVMLFDNRRLASMNTFTSIEPVDIAYYTLCLCSRLAFALRPAPPPRPDRRRHTARNAPPYSSQEKKRCAKT